MTFNIGNQNAGTINNVEGDQHVHGGQHGVASVAPGLDALDSLRSLMRGIPTVAADPVATTEVHAIDTALRRSEPDRRAAASALERLTRRLKSVGRRARRRRGLARRADRSASRHLAGACRRSRHRAPARLTPARWSRARCAQQRGPGRKLFRVARMKVVNGFDALDSFCRGSRRCPPRRRPMTRTPQFGRASREGCSAVEADARAARDASDGSTVKHEHRRSGQRRDWSTRACRVMTRPSHPSRFLTRRHYEVPVHVHRDFSFRTNEET